jgi:class 3 adenylate cyclase
MDQRTNRTFICSVLFLDIVEYSKKSVEEQISLKQRFNALLSEIIKDIAVNDRIILDTGDGAAIGFMGDPEDALFVAMALRDSIQNEQADPSLPLSVRMGINLGPVKLLVDINKQLNLIGDGINVAQRVMSFAQPGHLLVSRSYYEVISCLSQEYAKLFNYQGLHADKHIREHGIYAVGHYESTKDSGARLPSRRHIVVEANEPALEDRHQPDQSQSSGTQASGHGNAMSVLSAMAQRAQRLFQNKWLHFQNKWLYAAIPLAMIIILLGVVFLYRTGSPVKPTTVTAVSQPQPANAPAASSNTTSAENPKSTERPKAPEEVSSVAFRILPWGEIYIDGKKRGVSPPLTTVKLKPGKYRIEIKNSSFPVYSQAVEVKSNDKIEIKHKFQ